jgi:hypothetical protein
MGHDEVRRSDARALIADLGASAVVTNEESRCERQRNKDRGHKPALGHVYNNCEKRQG